MRPRPHQEMAENGSCPSAASSGKGPEGPENGHQILSIFNHRCRNSLNGIKMGLYLLKRGSNGSVHASWDELAHIYEGVERTFDRLQVIYRPMSLNTVRSSLGLLLAERSPGWRTLFTEKGMTLEIDRPDHDDPGDFDPMVLGMALDALVAWRANAGRIARRSVLGWRIADRTFVMSWLETDNANGPARDENAFSGPERTRHSACLDALALPLVVKVAAAHGGRTETTSKSGFGMALRWPQFQGSKPAP